MGKTRATTTARTAGAALSASIRLGQLTETHWAPVSLSCLGESAPAPPHGVKTVWASAQGRKDKSSPSLPTHNNLPEIQMYWLFFENCLE